MVEEMRYISITGPVDHMNPVIENYITRYDIQFEHAAKQLRGTEGLQPFTGANPYVEALHKAERFVTLMGKVPEVHFDMSGERAVKLVETANNVYEKRDNTLKELEYRRDTVVKYIDTLRNFASLEVDLQQLDAFLHISYAFGRMPVGNFKQFEKFLYDDSEILFVQSHSDQEFIWGVYFTPTETREKVDSIFSSLHFERLPVSSTCLEEQRAGTPAALIHYWQERLTDINKRLSGLTHSILNEIIDNKQELAAACKKVKDLYNTFDIKKYAAVTQNGRLSPRALGSGDTPAVTEAAGDTAISQRNYFVFVGWMSAQDAKALEGELPEEMATFFSRSGDTHDVAVAENPPTRLKNPPVIRLFEFFTQMYGLPAYGEVDPTPIMAIAYTLLFGLMFGDVGQGLVIAALGFYAYKRHKMPLGGIISVVGVSAMVFGWMYGSIFGIEEWIPALWRRPAENINDTLIFAVGVGVCIIFLSMTLNIINAVRQRHWGELFFSPNGIAGMMFYGMVLIVVLRVVVNGNALTTLDISLVCLPLFFVALREPIIKYMEGERKVIKGGLGMFLFSVVLELFETVLTYATNTISFVRVGAFAISHAGMMSVVLLLSQTAAGTHDPVVIILGNVLVMVIEGVLVCIQVLRLNFYEIFSRFYRGGGRLFETYRAKYKV